jgi:citrate lyase subunit beta/citryl-CoA lyase
MNRLRRSELATPATSERMVEKAAASDADLVFLDLEDAVAPAEKHRGRDMAIQALNELDWGSTLRAVRVNSADTEWAHDDVIELLTRAGENLDILMIPKVYGPRDVWFFETLVEQVESKLRLANRVGFEVLIEEAKALAVVEDIAASSPRLEALILGFGDLGASLGFRGASLVGRGGDVYPGDAWHFARARTIAAARANGLDMVDGPFGEFRDPEGYRREATWASTLGAVGKWAIHPSQIALAHEVFSPTADEVATAQEMVDAYEAAVANGQGAGATDSGTLVDAATLRLFAPLIERATQIAAK